MCLESQGCKQGEVTAQSQSISASSQITIQSLPMLSFLICLNFHLLLFGETLERHRSRQVRKMQLFLTAFLPRFERQVTATWQMMPNLDRKAVLFK